MVMLAAAAAALEGGRKMKGQGRTAAAEEGYKNGKKHYSWNDGGGDNAS